MSDDEKISNPEEALRRLFRLQAHAAMYAHHAATLEQKKAEIMSATAEMEMALLEGREELEKLRELMSNFQINASIDPNFIGQCDSFRPQMALLKRFGIKS